MKRTLCWLMVLSCMGALLAGCPNPPIRDGGKFIPISKVDLVARLNANSAAVQKIVMAGDVELKNHEHPGGITADATFAFQKPATICLGVSKIGSNILLVKSDGTYFEACDFENKHGWVGKIDYLTKTTDKAFFDLRPDFLSAAMALQQIDPAKTEMRLTDANEYILTIRESNGTKRELSVSGGDHKPVSQTVYAKDGSVLLKVDYNEFRDVQLPDGSTVFAPSSVTIYGREEGSTLKITNTDVKKFAVNNDRVFDNVMGPYGRSVKFPNGVPVEELQSDGTWKPIDIPPDDKGARIWRPAE